MMKSDLKKEQAFRKYAAAGNLQKLKELISQVTINSKDDITGMTALHLAVENSHIEIIKYLLSQNADRTIKNQRGKKAEELAMDDKEEIELQQIEENFVKGSKKEEYCSLEFLNKLSLLRLKKEIKEMFLGFNLAQKISKETLQFMPAKDNNYNFKNKRKESTEDYENILKRLQVNDSLNKLMQQAHNYAEMPAIIKKAIKEKSDSSFEFSCIAFIFFCQWMECHAEINFHAEIIAIWNNETKQINYCLLINRSPGTNLKEPNTWGNAIVVDGYSQKLCFSIYFQQYLQKVLQYDLILPEVNLTQFVSSKIEINFRMAAHKKMDKSIPKETAKIFKDAWYDSTKYLNDFYLEFASSFEEKKKVLITQMNEIVIDYEQLLRECAEKGKFRQLIELVIAKGDTLYINAADEKTGMTALHLAAKNNHENIVLYLLNRRANPSIKSRDNKTAEELTKSDDIKQLLIAARKNLLSLFVELRNITKQTNEYLPKPMEDLTEDEIDKKVKDFENDVEEHCKLNNDLLQEYLTNIPTLLKNNSKIIMINEKRINAIKRIIEKQFDKYIEFSCQLHLCEKSVVGNSIMFSCVAFMHLIKAMKNEKSNIFRVEIFSAISKILNDKRRNIFLVINRQENSSLEDSTSWGNDCILWDIYKNYLYFVSHSDDYQNNQMILGLNVDMLEFEILIDDEDVALELKEIRFDLINHNNDAIPSIFDLEKYGLVKFCNDLRDKIINWESLMKQINVERNESHSNDDPNENSSPVQLKK